MRVHRSSRAPPRSTHQPPERSPIIEKDIDGIVAEQVAARRRALRARRDVQSARAQKKNKKERSTPTLVAGVRSGHGPSPGRGGIDLKFIRRCCEQLKGTTLKINHARPVHRHAAAPWLPGTNARCGPSRFSETSSGKKAGEEFAPASTLNACPAKARGW